MFILKAFFCGVYFVAKTKGQIQKTCPFNIFFGNAFIPLLIS